MTASALPANLTDPRPTDLQLLKAATDRLRQLAGELDALVTLANEEPAALPQDWTEKVRGYCNQIVAGASSSGVILDVLRLFPDLPIRSTAPALTGKAA